MLLKQLLHPAFSSCWRNGHIVSLCRYKRGAFKRHLNSCSHCQWSQTGGNMKETQRRRKTNLGTSSGRAQVRHYATFLLSRVSAPEGMLHNNEPEPNTKNSMFNSTARAQLPPSSPPRLPHVATHLQPSATVPLRLLQWLLQLQTSTFSENYFVWNFQAVTFFWKLP